MKMDMNKMSDDALKGLEILYSMQSLEHVWNAVTGHPSVEEEKKDATEWGKVRQEIYEREQRGR